MVDTNDATDATQGDGSKISLSSLIPWSCKESFTSEVCGLPGQHSGCWRRRKLKVTDQLDMVRFSGVKRCLLDDPHQQRATWIVFYKRPGQEIKAEKYLAPKPSVDLICDRVIFGFEEDTLTPASKPTYVAYHSLDDTVKIEDWVNPDDRKQGLWTLFGRETFVRQHIAGTDLKLSVAELINAYMDRNCSRFRNQWEREVGIAMCKAGHALIERGLTRNVTITFSYIDPDPEDLTIKIFENLQLGRLGDESNPPQRLHSKFNEIMRRDDLKGVRDGSGMETTIFADCLSSTGRQYVLPSEVDQSFLHFPIGEIVLYLLHWVLLRIFACDHPANKSFIERFGIWRIMMGRGEQSHNEHFSALLGTKIALADDPLVFQVETARLAELEGSNSFLGTYPFPEYFDSVLATVGLGPNDDRSTYEGAATLLMRELDDYRQLPMYEKLNWQTPPNVEELARTLTESTWTKEIRQKVLEQILFALSDASGLKQTDMFRGAQDELGRHARRSVFPISHILTHWPCNVGVRDYYIFPLWDETILGEPRPVIFAHVFASMRESWAMESGDETGDEGVKRRAHELQALLLAFGQAFAHSYYRKIRQESENAKQNLETAWNNARAWAHEVKNYTAPIADALDSPRLQGRDVPRDVKEMIKYERRAVKILNAVSYAIQTAFSNRVSGQMMRDSQRLYKLQSNRAKGIVEAALQYLLNYRFENPAIKRKWQVLWEPKQSMNDAIRKLAHLLEKHEVMEDDIITHGEVVWVIALLREALWNIRNSRPFEKVPIITLRYSLTELDGDIVLKLEQQQAEKGEPDKEPPKSAGIENANVIFGPTGAGFGSIDFDRVMIQVGAEENRYEVSYLTQVRFAVDQQNLYLTAPRGD